MSSKTVREAVVQFERSGTIPQPKVGNQTRRGKHVRYPPGRLYIAELRRFAAEFNAAGIPATLPRLQKRLKDFGWDAGVGRETIRKTMLRIGFAYRRAGKTQNFTETEDIKRKRQVYLTQRTDPKLYVTRFLLPLEKMRV